MAIKPLGDRLLVVPNTEGETKKGSLYIPDTAKERPQEGKVVAAGAGRRGDNGELVPMEVKEGDTVLYGKYSGTEIKIDNDQDALILRESDVLAIIG
jgi:chaperonin GroES